MNNPSSSTLPPPVASPNSITIQGVAYVSEHVTGRGKIVPQLHFRANQDFEIADNYIRAEHFMDDLGTYGGRLLDHNGLTAAMKARDFFHLQRVEVTIVYSKGWYNLRDFKILSGLGFNPPYEFDENHLRDYPRQDLLPAEVVAQLAENAAIRATFPPKPEKGFCFQRVGLEMKLPYRKWTTKTGRAQDLVCCEVEKAAGLGLKRD